MSHQNGICESCYWYNNCKERELLGEIDHIANGDGTYQEIHIACDDYYWVNE